MIASSTVDITQTLRFLVDPELRQLLVDAGFGFLASIPQIEGLNLPQPVTSTTLAVTPPDPNAPVEPVLDPLTAFVNLLPTSFAFTQTVMQDLEVLAVGSDTQASPLGTGLSPQGSQILIFRVTFEEAEKLQFIQNNTSMALMLLPADLPYNEVESIGVIIDDIFDVTTRIERELEKAFGSG